MTQNPLPLNRVLILADRSALWRVAGLSQLERLILALNEFAGSNEATLKIDIAVFWEPGVNLSEDLLPERSRLPHIGSIASTTVIESGMHVLSTRLFVERGAMLRFLEEAQPVISEHCAVDLESWKTLFARFEQSCRHNKPRGNGWQFLENQDEIGDVERQFLSRAGKSQDGLVSRFLNRPISRRLTRLLLKFPITPTGWTLSIFVLPVITFIFLVTGTYLGILIATIIYQIYSVVDGCDGEIARAKYLESKRGGRIDDLCDVIGGLLFVIGLGVGLSRASATWVYATEGILCALLIATNEFLLRKTMLEPTLKSRELNVAMYPRHRQLVEHSALGFFGDKFAWGLVQITKRDVGILFFVLLAAAGLSQWILHLWAGVTLITLLLNVTAKSNVRADPVCRAQS